MPEGQLVWQGVLWIAVVRGWGDRMEAHIDHAWLMMPSHAHEETRVQSGELGAMEVVGDDDNGGDDHGPSRSSAASKALRGKGVGRPGKA